MKALAAAIEPLESRRLLATITVNTPVDAIFVNQTTGADPTGLISLRDAIYKANIASTPTTILIDPTKFPAGETNDTTLLLIEGNLELSNTNAAITIMGPASGAVTISGSKQRGGIFLVDPGVTANIADLTLSGGNADYSDIAGSLNGNGGAILNDGGTLALTDDSVIDNSASNQGGGIAGSGSLTLIGDYIAGNQAAGGGGVYAVGANLVMTNDTISGNSAATLTDDDSGGGVEVDRCPIFDLNDCTIAFNTISGGGPFSTGGGVAFANGTGVATVANSIIADNTDNTGDNFPDFYANGSPFVSLGNNLIGDIDGSENYFLGSTEKTGTGAKRLDPMLNKPANNGGPTLTCLPEPGSPAIDNGNNALIPIDPTTGKQFAHDQRGLPYARIIGNSVDIGAVEAPPTINISPPATTQTVNSGSSTSIALGSFTSPNGTSPYSVIVFWGDGSQPTTFTTNSTGTIPAQSHTFANSGNDTVKVDITDEGSIASDSFSVFISGGTSVQGTVLGDINGDDFPDLGDYVAQAVVYDDVNNNGTLDAGEPSAETDRNGNYQLYLGASGSATIRQVVPNGDAQEQPASNAAIKVKLSANSTSVNNDFIDLTPATTGTPVVYPAGEYVTLSGTVMDQTQSGPFQPGVDQVQIYDDLNDNGRFDAGEPLATTDKEGDYSLLLPAVGTAYLREIQPPGYAQSSPAGDSGIAVNLANPATATDLNFGETDVTPQVGQFTGTPSANTSSSYNNLGDTYLNVFDGNTNTSFDSPMADGNYVQLDLGSAKTITQIAYAPRVGFESRMVGGYFEASNDPSFQIGMVGLDTLTAAPADGLTTQSVSVDGTYEYVRYVAPAGSYGNIAELQVFGPGGASPPPTTSTELIGTESASTTLSYDGQTSDNYAAVFDNDTSTFWDSPNPSNNSVQTNLGSAQTLTQLDFAPRVGFESRMVGGVFEASNDPTFSTYTTIYTVSQTPTDGLTTVSMSGSYQYVRYVAPANSYGNIAEIELYGPGQTAVPVPVPPPAATVVQLSGTASGTAGSYDGKTSDNYSAVFDGNLGTFFDAPTAGTSASPNFVQFTLPMAETITQLQFAPRVGFEYRMTGGVFEVSNDATFAPANTTVVDTLTQAPSDGLTTVPVNGSYQFIRYIAPANSYANIAELQVYGVPGTAAPVTPPVTPTSGPLSGTSSGTTGSYDGQTSDNYAAVFDGSTSTFFDAPTAGTSASPNYVQLSFSAPKTITSLAFAPRSGFGYRMVGGYFEASNDASFRSNDTTVLYTIGSTPSTTLTTITFPFPGSYQYVRYVAPVGGYGNIAEMQLFGY